MRIVFFESRLAKFKKLPALEAARKTMEITMRAMMIASTRRSDCGMTCANCGDLRIAPEWSEHKDEHHVLSLWSCSKCGIEFDTDAFVTGGVESGDDKAIKTFFPSLLVA